MKRYFITGTDTHCGKTYVTAELLLYFRQHGKKSLAIKPIATGCYEQDGILINEDALYLSQHNAGFAADINPWRFKPPIAPHLAANAAGVSFCADSIAHFCRDSRFTEQDILCIEGAGGLMVPLNDRETWVDMVKILQSPIILVVGMKLGCLNHALLSDAVIMNQDLPYLGWVANCIDPHMEMFEENRDTLEKKMSKPLLGTVNFKQRFEATTALNGDNL